LFYEKAFFVSLTLPSPKERVKKRGLTPAISKGEGVECR
jgi:hypothetical protein